jgi:2-polyprenyl-3-methyl-5-hydroxy-6-metoxy-1,4-benzoquinol methylase
VERNQLYSDKDANYFTGERRDLIDRLMPDPGRAILELGCGDGATGGYAKRTGRCGLYVGLELSAGAAKIAASVIDQVLVGNVEEMRFPFEPASFDVMIASEVLEHLVDPWDVLRRLRVFLKPGATVFASSPNIAYRSTLGMLLAGRWDLDRDGRMDRTHLRWFTPRTYAQLFADTGFEVITLKPLVAPGRLARLATALSGNRLSHLFISQMVVEARVGDTRLSASSAGTIA